MSATIKIGRDFSRYPAGRFRSDGKWSGERFREEHLLPALASDKTVDVVIDDVAGLPASFLEEAFGGLIRSGVPSDELRRRLRVAAAQDRYQRYVPMIWDMISTASRDPARVI